MDPEITVVEQLVWAGGWNKGAFEPLPHNAYCYHYLYTYIHYSDTKMMNIFSICYIGCAGKVQILPFFFFFCNRIICKKITNFTRFYYLGACTGKK